MFLVERITGPECPKCGCQASEVIAVSRNWNVSHERRRCDHCAAIFSVPADPDAADESPKHKRRHGRRPVIYPSPATCSGPMAAVAEGAGQGLTGESIRDYARDARSS